MEHELTFYVRCLCSHSLRKNSATMNPTLESRTNTLRKPDLTSSFRGFHSRLVTCAPLSQQIISSEEPEREPQHSDWTLIC
eukprot:3720278-Amphidinium_carterae.1